MIEYIYTDETNQQKSIARVNSVDVPYWQSLFTQHGQQEVEVFLQAEVLRQQGNQEGVLMLVEPYFSGENTYRLQQLQDENGNWITIESGADTRSWLKKWYQAYYG